MFRYALPLALPVSLAVLLSACGHEEAAQTTVRPAMVVQPEPAAQAMDSYPGEVRARYEPDLAFRIGGKVSRRLVDEGQRVKADQPLAELDPQDVRLQLEATRAQVAAAEANLNLVRSERDRYKTLMDRQLVSRSQYDNAENLYRSGQARLKQIKAEFDVASNQAGYAVLRAPQDGVVARRTVEVGQVVAAGQTVFTLATDGEREVLISLPEQGFGRFHIGQPVSVELWSQPDQRFAGQIRELSPAADPRSRTFAARIAFTAGKVPAELGQSARVFIQAAASVPLSVPLSAVTAENGAAYVWRVDANNTLKKTPVRLGAFGEKSVPVLEGLGVSDWVVAAGVHVLHEGQQVRPVDRSNRVVNLAAKE
ncbi:efflux RND transporter periplasmic adaptor subunit [Pseudomonas chlororaphis]|uniref:Multidrug efflux system, membrane fusion component MexJ n=1 Tax=Pseudomonas chlororaphis subsp. aureofaciens TaxID=587851 RepID=A0AAD1E4H0_9PSED|nr:efflux RND transporter periplasmic adaptor subunit [Pseudomonas chlororaphis]AZD84006.1 Multidrug efflux system, membrane fusion component MexJ [Pseudomonas chlororaphis subsp. aureofaciens]AZD97089.1 Multidrug efflux system, membrane fusion component MexJ [Pseudomonas chlororaphis subsp. aureofaciens]AZE03336.1 Multidrug efflux system, membrane fusion component MexJ [Pseudomonas chlororaphis subsp. aureofaciens]AZE27977.1 Multidrug efflux system, membrane fusion component MexJ [Pseudomonas 